MAGLNNHFISAEKTRYAISFVYKEGTDEEVAYTLKNIRPESFDLAIGIIEETSLFTEENQSAETTIKNIAQLYKDNIDNLAKNPWLLNSFKNTYKNEITNEFIDNILDNLKCLPVNAKGQKLTEITFPRTRKVRSQSNRNIAVNHLF